ncbi:MAG: hypothetical protein GX112_14750 [Clostridiaceae bacterium]|nr:hypothetical protein [Clostridiaceae bacterium]
MAEYGQILVAVVMLAIDTHRFFSFSLAVPIVFPIQVRIRFFAVDGTTFGHGQPQALSMSLTAYPLPAGCQASGRIWRYPDAACRCLRVSCNKENRAGPVQAVSCT